MLDTKKEQEREELHRAIWAIADELRGAVDGWDFKNYVLGTMFYRYISENLCSLVNQEEISLKKSGFDFAKISDTKAENARESLVEEKGFFILPTELFCNVNEEMLHFYWTIGRDIVQMGSEAKYGSNTLENRQQAVDGSGFQNPFSNSVGTPHPLDQQMQKRATEAVFLC